MGISDSRFNMWRAVAAMVHADDVVQPHEINFILEGTKKLPLSEEQRAQLIEDLQTPGDIEACFRNITISRDKEDFFHLARAIAWSDGEFDAREQALLERVRNLPVAKQDVEIMERAIIDFPSLYIGGEEKSGEESIFSLIRGLLRVKAA